MKWLLREVELHPSATRTTIALWKLIALWVTVLGLPYLAIKIIVALKGG